MKKYLLILSIIFGFFLSSCEMKSSLGQIGVESDNEIKNEVVNNNAGIISTGIIDNESKIKVLSPSENKLIESNKVISIIKTGKYCMLDECIPSNAKVTTSGAYYVAKMDLAESESSYEYKLSKNYDYFEIIEGEIMNTINIKINKFGSGYIKTITNFGCGGSRIEQKAYNIDGKELKSYIFEGIKKNIFIGNIRYTQNLVGSGKTSEDMYNYSEGFKIYRENNNKGGSIFNGKYDYKVFNNEQEFINYATNDVLNKDKILHKRYIVQYKKYKGIKFMYTSQGYNGKAIRVVYLGNDVNYLSKYIKSNGDYMDLKLTNKIIGYYSGEDLMYGIYDLKGNKVTKADSLKLPIFNMQKFNNKGNYLVYLKPGYDLTSQIEMCKPVIYYYSTDNEKNSLNLKLKKNDYFTKLIPALDNNNTWNFESDNGKIKVENKKYDYLYYSLVTTGYSHNNDGWIVKGQDVEDFFEDKLSKINFKDNEKTDFIDFWKNEYENDRYYFISFKYKEYLDKIVKLNFDKKPDSEFRVLLDSYEIINYSDEVYRKYLYRNVGDKFDKYLINSFERGTGNREVFEWGGVLVKNNETIIK